MFVAFYLKETIRKLTCVLTTKKVQISVPSGNKLTANFIWKHGKNHVKCQGRWH